MTKTSLILPSMAAVLILSACGQPAAPVPAPTTDAANPVATTPAAMPPQAAPSNTANGPAAHVGKLPSEGFLDDPGVAAVLAKVPAEARQFIRTRATMGPIASEGGKAIAYGCEPHNCAGHNWSVMMAPDGKSGDVCVFENRVPGPGLNGVATWYLAKGGQVAGNVDGCPRDADEMEKLYPAN